MRTGLRGVSSLVALAICVASDLAAEGPPNDLGRDSGGGRASGARELMGRVVKTGPNVLYLEHMGAVVAFRITPKTEFTGLGARSSRDLAEGQQVLATFTVEGKTTNQASRIAATSEAAGEPRSPSEQGRGPVPGVPRGLPGPPDHGPTAPRVPPGQPVPGDPGVPAPRQPIRPPL